MSDEIKTIENSATKKKQHFKLERPGRLISEVQLALNTVDAQTAFSGYQSKEAISLLQFAGKMTEIWNATEKDDPYADLFLLKVYDNIIKLRNQLATTIQDYQHQLDQHNKSLNLKLTPFISEKPLVKSLWFRTQYGYLAANIIADFDELMRTVLTANRVGVLLEKPHDVIREEWLNQIQLLFKLPFKWQQLNITRTDILAKNELAQKAQEQMGALPDKVLSKTLRSPFAPNIKEVPTVESSK